VPIAAVVPIALGVVLLWCAWSLRANEFATPAALAVATPVADGAAVVSGSVPLGRCVGA